MFAKRFETAVPLNHRGIVHSISIAFHSAVLRRARGGEASGENAAKRLGVGPPFHSWTAPVTVIVSNGCAQLPIVSADDRFWSM